MDNLSTTLSDFEYAKRLQEEENRMILHVEQTCFTSSTSSEETSYVERLENSEEKYGSNLLENDIADDEDDFLEATRPNTLNDSLLAQQLQANEFNATDTDESAVRSQSELGRESRAQRENMQDVASSLSDDDEQTVGRVRLRDLLNPFRRNFSTRRSNASSMSRHRIPESIHNLIHGLSRAISIQHFHDFTADPVGYLEESQLGGFFRENAISGDDYEALWDIAERLGDAKNRGLKKRAINNLPTSTFSNENRDDTINGASCVVCMETYEVGDKLKTLPCLHYYHHECIDKWLERQRKCPVCQHVLQN